MMLIKKRGVKPIQRWTFSHLAYYLHGQEYTFMYAKHRQLGKM